eukprot:123007_1
MADTAAKSIFEETASSQDPSPKKEAITTNVSTRDDEKREMEPAYPPNSINNAKAHYQQNKHRDSKDYVRGSPKKPNKKNYVSEVVTNLVDDVKQQIMPQIEQTTDKFLSATDNAFASLAKSTGIQFAPIKIPLKRRRQTFAVLIWSCMYLIAVVLNFIAFRYWTGWKFYLYIMYLGWKIMYQTFHSDGGLPIPWLRNCFFFKWFTDFFPIRLHKTYDLDESGETSYLFGYHPHGIIGMGAVGTFAMMTSGFHRLFPGVDVRLLTLKVNFYVPFFDLLISFMGICDASRDSCNNILSDAERKSLCLVLGGAKESLEANPGIVKLYLKNRKGFVKVALENGASLVPVFGFGENELFDQVANPEGSMVRNIQNQLQKRMGFALPLFHGRGVFQYNFGILPKRIPIDVVFGKPIPCPQINREQITSEIINKYHTMYCNELKTVFDQNKARFYDKGKTMPEMILI